VDYVCDPAMVMWPVERHTDQNAFSTCSSATCLGWLPLPRWLGVFSTAHPSPKTSKFQDKIVQSGQKIRQFSGKLSAIRFTLINKKHTFLPAPRENKILQRRIQKMVPSSINVTNYEHITVKVISQHVLEIALSRHSALNAMNHAFFNEIYDVFNTLPERYSEIRVILLISTHPKLFTAGLDLKAVQSGEILPTSAPDPARFGVIMMKLIQVILFVRDLKPGISTRRLN
jgi:hypothetical protein